MATLRSCANCSKTAKYVCQRCKGCLSGEAGVATVSTSYCSKGCQVQHWSTHKTECNDRWALFRAVETAFQLFITLCHANYILTVERLEKKGSVWNTYPLKKRPGTSLLVPFPEDAIPSLDDQAAILCDRKCLSHLADLHILFKALLTDITMSIEEVEFWRKNTALKIRHLYEHGAVWDMTEYKHWVLRVTLKNKEAYAIDITGAQSGWKERILPWNYYVQQRVRNYGGKAVNMLPFGHCVGLKKEKFEKRGQVHNYILDERFNEALNIGFKQWAIENKINLADLHRLPDSKFIEEQSDFLQYMREYMQAFRDYCIKARRCENANPNEDLDAVPYEANMPRRYNHKPGVITERDGYCQMTLPDGQYMRVKNNLEEARRIFEEAKKTLGW